MLTNYKISSHLSRDRVERVVYIGTTVGFGDVKYVFPVGDHYQAITNTGVLIILGADKLTIITMFLLDVARAKAIFVENNFSSVPPIIDRIIVKNMKTGICKNCP